MYNQFLKKSYRMGSRSLKDSNIIEVSISKIFIESTISFWKILIEGIVSLCKILIELRVCLFEGFYNPSNNIS